MIKKVPNPIDKHVGSRVRMRRMLAGVSQEKLGEALGLTFQQVQKYEKGSNRISASRLQQIAKMLDVPVSFFFDGAPTGDMPEPGFADSAATTYISEFLATSELPAGDGRGLTVAYHAACSLQHGQKVTDAPSLLLKAVCYQVRTPLEAHLFCGSAGSYYILQPEIAGQLGDR